MKLIRRIKEFVSKEIKSLINRYKIYHQQLTFEHKRIQLANELLREEILAELARRALQAKLDILHQIITFSANVTDRLNDPEHQKTMKEEK